MGLIEILWTAAGIIIPLLLGTAWAMIGLTPPEFWIARSCIGGSALIFGGVAIFWLSETDLPGVSRVTIALIFGAVALVVFSESLRLVNSREKVLISQANAEKDKRAEVKAKLQEFYVAVGGIINRKIPSDISNEDFDKYLEEANSWANDTAIWIQNNMGTPAMSRFLDRTSMQSVRFVGTHNNEHNNTLTALNNYRKNLIALIESGAWDKAENNK